MVKQVRKARNVPRRLPRRVVQINASFNNTIVNVTDSNGNVVAWSSAGACGFKGAKRGTPFAAQMAAQQVVQKCTDMGMKRIEVVLRGPGAGRDTSVRALHAGGLAITLLRDITALPHNGCRPPKNRRV